MEMYRSTLGGLATIYRVEGFCPDRRQTGHWAEAGPKTRPIFGWPVILRLPRNFAPAWPIRAD
jgi:hypothetical protein